MCQPAKELLKNEESRALKVELDATRCVSGARGSKDHHFGSGVGVRRVQTEPFDGVEILWKFSALLGGLA